MTAGASTDPRRAAIARLDAAMSKRGLDRVDTVDLADVDEVLEYGDPLDGRAFTVDAAGVIDETDR